MVREKLIRGLINRCVQYIKTWKASEFAWPKEEYRFLCGELSKLDDLERVKVFTSCLAVLAALCDVRGGMGPAAASMVKSAIVRELVLMDLAHENKTGNFVPHKGDVTGWVTDMLRNPSISPEEQAQADFERMEENGPIGRC